MKHLAGLKIDPVKPSERYVILDVLRGIALVGICLANYPEFSLYTFQEKEVVEAMPTAGIDHLWRYFHYIFIDGKFYSLFSLLFGIGFSIILSKAVQQGKGLGIFYRRMFILAIIGFVHLIFLWAGDILLLYALVGMLLPLFRNVSNRKLLLVSASLILFPIAIDAFRVLTDHRFTLLIPVEKAIRHFSEQNGITGDNFPVWLLEGKSYPEVVKFNVPGSFIRCREFIEGCRVFKVLGLFLLGLYIGRNRIHAQLDERMALLKKIRNYGFLAGLPLSCLFAWSEVNRHPAGLVANTAIYALSVVPLSLAFASAVCVWYAGRKDLRFFRIMAAPGRMALTNYIGQSAIGMILFYGIGFGWALTGLIYVELIAAGVFAFQTVSGNVWLRYFRFGPLEWIWRMLTYGKWLKIN
ncbi:MAG: DUF418 domain-containing protein [Bacteroidales bacterium]|jgi:uncharacterized protein|nr:DUF418 domain-containing protein [Bacteroidales bacterium]